MSRGVTNFPLVGPLASFAEGFTAHLVSQGYTDSGISGQRGLLAHLDRWMVRVGLGLPELTPLAIDRFLQARREAGYVTKLSGHGIKPLLGYLEDLGALSIPNGVSTPIGELVDLFRRYELEERGLGRETASNYERIARLFLSTRTEPLRVSLAELSAADISAFILEQTAHRSVVAAQTLVQGLRALLKFLHVAGWTRRGLASAVPTVARRRQDHPRALDDEHVQRLLDSCDRNTPVGIRDFAILTVLARLGVRAGEIARMELEDIDWPSGELLVRGKGPRSERLPLPHDVGEAIVDYLRRARPVGSCRRLFIRSCAPLTGLTRQAIGGLVRAASVRAGITAHGPHRLRHSVATGLLRRGAALPEIAQLLRHKSIQTTVIYAKVDHTALSALVQVWPGGDQ